MDAEAWVITDGFERVGVDGEQVRAPALSVRRQQESNWAGWLKHYSRDESVLFSVQTFDGKKTHRVVFRTSPLNAMQKAAINVVVPVPVGEGVPMACNACRHRLNSLLTYRAENGSPCFLSGPKEHYPVDFHPMWHAARLGEIADMRIATSRMFAMHREGGFDHFSVYSTQTFPDYTDEEVVANNRLLVKYSEMFHKTFMENGKPGFLAGLKILKKALVDITYGDKLGFSIDWLIQYLPENYAVIPRIEQLKVLATAILSVPPILEAGSLDPTIQVYHQSKNNTIDALACAKDLGALKTLLQDRFNPNNYQVKTAPPKEGNVAVAKELIGDFSVKLMTVSDAVEYGATLVETSAYSANTAYSKLAAGRGSKSSVKSGAANFASRCVETQFPDTLAEIVKNPPADLEIDTTDLKPVYASKFVGLTNGVYKAKGTNGKQYTWGFANKYTAAKFGMSKYRRVLAILELSNRSVFFICDGATTVPAIMGVCCHPELLTPEYNRVCGPTWGNMSTVMSLQIDSTGEPYAIGVGTSYGNLEARKLVNTARFRVGSKCFTISK